MPVARVERYHGEPAIMIDGKPYYQHYALAEQALWLLVMCCILCEALMRAGHLPENLL